MKIIVETITTPKANHVIVSTTVIILYVTKPIKVLDTDITQDYKLETDSTFNRDITKAESLEAVTKTIAVIERRLDEDVNRLSNYSYRKTAERTDTIYTCVYDFLEYDT